VTRAAYDDIAEWYEHEFMALQRSAAGGAGFADGLGIDRALVELLGAGRGTCVEVGCGTGIYAGRLGSLGWAPVGVDLSAGMLAYTRGRLPAALGDGRRLPFPTSSVAAAVSVMMHTDTPDYAAVVREIHRVLVPGGRFVHVGVHPCFCGGFADRSEPPDVIVRPGYLEAGWTPALGPTEGALGADGQVRDKVGAGHSPLAELFNTISDAGLTVDRLSEGFEPTPITLSLRATKG
jgi:SAM-dependent methyltransferase